jgi:2Fe-2S ferredoxin
MRWRVQLRNLPCVRRSRLGQEDGQSGTLEAAFDVQENSRLSCQIEVSDELDGLVVRMPELQI